MDDSQAIRQIATAASEDDVLAIARAFYRTQGFAALSYARPSRDNPGRSEVTSFGFPEGFIADYRDGLAEFDPLPGLATEGRRRVTGRAPGDGRGAPRGDGNPLRRLPEEGHAPGKYGRGVP